MSSSEENEVTSKKRKKGVKNVSDYKSEVIKKSRVKGETYTNWRGHAVESVTLGPDCR